MVTFKDNIDLIYRKIDEINMYIEDIKVNTGEIDQDIMELLLQAPLGTLSLLKSNIESLETNQSYMVEKAKRLKRKGR